MANLDSYRFDNPLRNCAAQVTAEAGETMNYPDGRKVLVGDRLKLWEGSYGVVVFSIDDDEYTPEFPKEHWEYLKQGIMIRSDLGGLVHYTEPERSFELIERRQSKP